MKYQHEVRNDVCFSKEYIFSPLKKPRSNEHLEMMDTPSIQIVVYKNIFPVKKELLGNLLIPGLEQEMYKMNFEHTVVSESKATIKDK